jgi:hypothetical protein
MPADEEAQDGGRLKALVSRWRSWHETSARATSLRTGALTLMLLAGAAYFLDVVNGHYAIRTWLFPSYAGYWLLTLLFNAACFSGGHALLGMLVPKGLPLRERIVLSMAVGVFAFYAGSFAFGLAHLYGPVFFVAWPVAMVVAGLPSLVRRARCLRHALRAGRRAPARRQTLLGYAISWFAVLALAVIYLAVMVPENVAFDARLYHLPIAEHYAALKGIEALPEGSYPGAYPQLAGILYTWAMLWRWAHVVDRVLLCAHLEFSLFLWTLYGVTVLARRIVPGRDMRLSWVAVFLFPILFVYDSNLNTTADHIAAFWACPIFLALLRAWPRLEMRPSVLLGVLVAGAISTKYQGVYLAAFPCVALALRAPWLHFRQRRDPKAGLRPLASALAAAFTTTLLWTPHWLKNLAWYGDPFYPLLHGVLHSHPWTADNDLRLELNAHINVWRPAGATFGARLVDTIKAMWSFSFLPHDWNRLDGLPVFGSLFTLLLPALPFLRARGRVWALFLASNVGLFVWYWGSHQDRYLQLLLPWLAGCVAAAIALAWDSGVVARIGLAVLIGAQVVWGGDAPFLHSHRMLGESQLKVAFDRITSGFDHALGRRSEAFREVSEIGDALPPGAHVLFHEDRVRLGLQHASVDDHPEAQGGISYGRFRSPAELNDRLRSYGVTHIAMQTGKSAEVDGLSGDVVFFDYVNQYARKWRTFGGWTVFELPAERPPDVAYGDILWLGCDNTTMYAWGRYAMADMTTPFRSDAPRSSFPPPRVPVAADDPMAIDLQAAQVAAVGFDPACVKAKPARLDRDFTHVTDRHTLQIWIRRGGARLR